MPGVTDRQARNERGFRNDRGAFRTSGLIDDRGFSRSDRSRGGNREALRASGFDGGGGQVWRERFGNRDVDLSRANFAPFRERARDLRRQAQTEGWNFDERDYRRNVWEYTQREAWRDNLLRSAISVNLGYRDDYYYIPPPAYTTYSSIAYDPYYYNIGSTYYDPGFGGFYVSPVSYAYRPYDYYYSSYNYYDPYYFDDPTDDFVTVRLFASNYGTGFISRLVGGLLAYGYDQGYRDGLLAREAGYVDYSYYEDPYVYYDDTSYVDSYEDEYYEETVDTTYSFYEPYNSYSVYENRRCLSEGYELGYRDALYGNGEYDPYEAVANVDLVSVYVGATWQLV